MKKSLVSVLIVMLMILLVFGTVFAERRVCGTCNGTGVVCKNCIEPLPGIHSRCVSCNISNAAIVCFICDGKRYVEVDVCN